MSASTEYNGQTKVIQNNDYFQYTDKVYSTYEGPVAVSDRETVMQDFANFILNNSSVLAHVYDNDVNAGHLTLLHNASMAYARALSE